MRLSTLLSNGMVLQRDTEDKIWGYSDCDTGVNLSLADTEGKMVFESKADVAKDGTFEFTIPAVNAGGPYSLILKDEEDEITIRDILFGDVFLFMGQSNCELPVNRTYDITPEYRGAQCEPLIRYFDVPKEYDFHDLNNDFFKGCWQGVYDGGNTDINAFSALSYYFGLEAIADTNVPVGLINTGCGGIQIEALIAKERLLKVRDILVERDRKDPSFKKPCLCGKNHYCYQCYDRAFREDEDDANIVRTEKEEALKSEEWNRRAFKEEDTEKYKNASSLYEDGETPKYINVPGLWENLKENEELEKVRGVVWTLKTFEVPDSFIQDETKLYLGTLVDMDMVYINGVQIGITYYRYPPRRYMIPKGVLKPGKNTIAVCIATNNRAGGFVPEMPYYVKNLRTEECVSLEGKWEVRVSTDLKEDREETTFFLYRPCGMYNKMIYPLRNLSLKGAVFYQGESNTKYAVEYEYLLREYLDEIRDLFRKDLPIAVVALPMYGGEDDERGTTNWDDLRASQLKVADVPNTCVVDIYDLGFKYELHPQNKKKVAQRVYKNIKEIL